MISNAICLQLHSFITLLAWVTYRVLIVVVWDVCVGCATTPGKLQNHHARCSDGLAQLIHVSGNDAQVLCNDGHMTQLLQAQQLQVNATNGKKKSNLYAVRLHARGACTQKQLKARA